MLVSVPGYADSFVQGRSFFQLINGRKVGSVGFLDDSVTVKMRQPVPIEGRLLNFEGQPVSDVSVGVIKVVQPDSERIGPWLAKASKQPTQNNPDMLGQSKAPDTYFPMLNEVNYPQDQPAVTSDSDGRFRFDKLLGKGDVAVLRIRGERIADQVIHVMARDMKPIYAQQLTVFTDRGAYYGRKFNFITQPSVDVFGVVRDIDSKEPLANVPVAVNSIHNSQMSQYGYISTTTDSQGRYRIKGLPIIPKGTKDRNELSARPVNLPYIETDHFDVPVGDGMNPIEFNMELRRAVMVKGRITEKGTGKPLVAEIYFAPFATNENCQKYKTYSSGISTMLGNNTRYHSDEKGNFQIPAIPGRGVIAAIVRESNYVTGHGANEIEEFRKEESKKIGRFFAYGHIVPSLFHSLKEINVQGEELSHDVELDVDPGVSVTLKITGPDGLPFKGAEGFGVAVERIYKRDLPSSIEVKGLAHGKVRAINISANDGKLARMAQLIPKKGQAEYEIQLLPKSRLSGRLIDNEGNPLPDIVLRANHRNDPDFLGGLNPNQTTDNGGRFKFDLPVGATYNITGQTANYFRVVEEFKNEEPKLIDLGDIVVDRTAKRWATMKAKREPVIRDLAPENHLTPEK